VWRVGEAPKRSVIRITEGGNEVRQNKHTILREGSMPDALLTFAAYGACMTSLSLGLVGLYWVLDGLLDQLRKNALVKV
jgi:hypothetical protein